MGTGMCPDLHSSTQEGWDSWHCADTRTNTGLIWPPAVLLLSPSGTRAHPKPKQDTLRAFMEVLPAGVLLLVAGGICAVQPTPVPGPRSTMLHASE